MHSRGFVAAALAAAVLVMPARRSARGRRRDAAARVPERRDVARQLRRAGHASAIASCSRCRPASGPMPPLQLVDMPAARVDWDRTSRYAASARATHYIQTQAENDYADALERRRRDVERRHADHRSGQAARARRARAEDARRLAAESLQLPAERSPADADHARRGDRGPSRGRDARPLRADAVGVRRSADDRRAAAAGADARKESIEQTLTAAHAVDVAAERTALLGAALATIDREKAALPADWVAHDARRDRGGDSGRAARRPLVSAAHEALCAAGRIRARASADVQEPRPGCSHASASATRRSARKRPDAVERAGGRGRGQARRGAPAAARARALGAARAGAPKLPARDCARRWISSPS